MFLKLIIMQPRLLMNHLQNYADLVIEDLPIIANAWRLRLLMYALSCAFFLLGLVSVTTALLLWGALPVLNSENAWLLCGLPVFLFSASMFFYWITQRFTITPLFDAIQAQLKLDMLSICQSRNK